MRQRTSSRIMPSPPKPTRMEPPDPFRFGWRYVRQPGANGSSSPERVPLTPDDILHPQWGDQIPEQTYQERSRRYLASVLNYRLANRPGSLVLSDCLVDWGVNGLRGHSPDISVFDGVEDRTRDRKCLAVRDEGARPVLVVEIVSVDPYARRLRDNDVVIKVKEYFRAGVPLYVIVDQEKVDGPRRLLGYRRGPRKFVPVALDDQGRLPLGPVGVLLALRDDILVCFDAAAEEEIPDFADMAAALAAAQVRIKELETQLPKRPRGRGRRTDE